MVLTVFISSVFLSSEELAFHDDGAIHFTVEFHAWDHEMTYYLPVSMKPSIHCSHRGHLKVWLTSSLPHIISDLVHLESLFVCSHHLWGWKWLIFFFNLSGIQTCDLRQNTWLNNSTLDHSALRAYSNLLRISIHIFFSIPFNSFASSSQTFFYV